MGYFDGTRFHISVGLENDPTPEEVVFLGELFGKVSQALHVATAGAHSLGYVFFARNGSIAENADIRILPNSDAESATGARLYNPGTSIDFGRNNLSRVTLLLHELGHYFYDLGDEHKDPSGTARSCPASTSVNPDPRTACIMDNRYDSGWSDGAGGIAADWGDGATSGFWHAYRTAGGAVAYVQGIVEQFCYAGNHTHVNVQHSRHGVSCWEAIGTRYPLTAPTADPAATAVATSADPVKVVELVPASRYVLVLDRSASMAGGTIAELRIGAHFWVDYVQSPEQLGIITFDGQAATLREITEVSSDQAVADAWRTDLHAAIDSINPGNDTAIGDALRLALDKILAGGMAANSNIVLFTDGLQNAGSEDISDVMDDLVASGVKVQVIGLGDDQDSTLLESLADQTGGVFVGISTNLAFAASLWTIRDYMIAIAAQIRPDSGIICFEDVDPIAVERNVIPFDWGPPRGGGHAVQEFLFPVQVTAGSVQCTIGVSPRDPGLSFEAELLLPDSVPQSERAKVRVRSVGDDRPYRFFVVDSPPPGTYQLRVRGNDLGSTRFRVFGFETNPRVRLTSVIEPVDDPGLGRYRLQVFLRVPELVPDAEVRAWIGTSSGAWTQQRFVETGNAREQHSDPPVYTAVIETGARARTLYTVAIDVESKADRFKVLDGTQDSRNGGAPVLGRVVDHPDIRRRAMLSFVTGPPVEFPNGMVPGFNPKPPRVPDGQKGFVKRWLEEHKR